MKMMRMIMMMMLTPKQSRSRDQRSTVVPMCPGHEVSLCGCRVNSLLSFVCYREGRDRLSDGFLHVRHSPWPRGGVKRDQSRSSWSPSASTAALTCGYIY
ncbi:hypothetical protein EYF80_016579 [Liparis tanakae]|uniref:Uncharacterized protein n=1 Tax=Liparis tanakae TaxID=230148 RepID=A0A4Z2I7E7_9TELE|nr:hypothetical protein EYF80_016579 [Liparis tanakae]